MQDRTHRNVTRGTPFGATFNGTWRKLSATQQFSQLLEVDETRSARPPEAPQLALFATAAVGHPWRRTGPSLVRCCHIRGVQ